MSATIAGRHPSGAAVGGRALAEAAAPYLALIGRVMLSAIFILSGVSKLMDWSRTADSMAAEGMIAVPVLLAGAVVFELFGGAAVLLGCYARAGALALAAFLVPTTLIFHDFWTFSGEARMNQMQHFMKNLTITGGLLILAASGPGRFAFDARGSESGGSVTPAR
jgi:putative oxidoreductase